MLVFFCTYKVVFNKPLTNSSAELFYVSILSKPPIAQIMWTKFKTIIVLNSIHNAHDEPNVQLPYDEIIEKFVINSSKNNISLV